MYIQSLVLSHPFASCHPFRSVPLNLGPLWCLHCHQYPSVPAACRSIFTFLVVLRARGGLPQTPLRGSPKGGPLQS